MVLKRTFEFRRSLQDLTSKSIKGAALTLEGIDNIHGCDCLPLGMFSVGDCITDDIFKENLQNSSSLLIDETRNALHTSTASQPSNCRLGNALDIISQNFSMKLGAPLPSPLPPFPRPVILSKED